MKVLTAFKLLAVILVCCADSTSYAKVADSVGIVSVDQFTPPANEPGVSAYIELSQQQQEKNLCVPTSASMVLQKTGTAISPREIKVLSSNKRQRRNQEFDDFTQTMFVDLLAGLAKIDVHWDQRTYRNNSYGFRDGLSELKEALDSGSPVLTDTSLYGGHTFAVVGYDETKRQVIAVDPAIPAPGLRVISYDDFEDIWNSRGVGFNGRGAVFTSPKR
jgi:hypothetical protein